jgi:hypothetical protein
MFELARNYKENQMTTYGKSANAPVIKAGVMIANIN